VKRIEADKTSRSKEAEPRSGRRGASARTLFSLSEDETYELGRSLGRGAEGIARLRRAA